ncbi:MAG: hypothetical protein IBJ16_15190 [Chitinophagaceae bacterium]|nr:hypothetical protein [Chitinophagaceae bacterium]
MNTDSLFSILQKIKPDVILDEMQSPSRQYTKEKELRKLPITAGIRTKLGIGKKPSPEKLVLYKYKKFYPVIIIRPFDIYVEDRRKYFLRYEAWEKNFYSILNNPKHSNTFSPFQKKLFYEYLRLNNYMYDLTQKSYLDMNQSHVSDSLRQMLAITDPFFTSVLDSLEIAAPLKPYYEKNKFFWGERNEKMTSNILEYVEQYPGTRIVVLTGLLHKHCLIDLLNQSPKKDLYKILEFYDPQLEKR